MILKRSKIEIHVDVLRVISEGTHKPTRIMYKINLSWKPLMEIIDFMIEQDPVSMLKNGVYRTYEIIDKGKNTTQVL